MKARRIGLAPMGMAGVADTEPVLTIDPRRQFGRVCIVGTRIPAESVAGSVWADGLENTIKDYGVTRDQAILACWWEVECARGSRRKFDRRMVERWGQWADNEVVQHLGGHHPGPCPAPPDPR